MALDVYPYFSSQTHLSRKTSFRYTRHYQQSYLHFSGNRRCIIVQQCQMLESKVCTNVLVMCLKNPVDAPAIVRSTKKEILKSDLEALLSCSATHPSAKYVAIVAKATSWCRLWDLALDRGVQGTRGLQTLLKELSRRIDGNFLCSSCGISLCTDSLWFDHVCMAHSDAVNYLWCEDIISSLREANADIVFSVANSKLNIFSTT